MNEYEQVKEEGLNGQPGAGIVDQSYGDPVESGGMMHQQPEGPHCGGGHEEQDDNMDTQCPPASHSDGGDIQYDQHKLFIGGLHPATEQQKLTDYFSRFGTIKEVNLKVDPETKKARFSFLIFEEATAVDEIIKAGPHEIDGKIVDAKKAIPHNLHQQMKLRTKKVFVGGVPTEMPEEVIRAYFEQFGEVEDVALVTQKGATTRRGFCFVTFVYEDAADRVCAKDKGIHKLDGKTEVEVKRATPRDENKKNFFGNGPPHFQSRGGRGFPAQSPGGRGGHFAPYGGHAAYYPFFPPPHAYGMPYGGGGGAYGGYGGYNYDQYGPPVGRREDGYNSRYGPMRSNYGHGHSHSHVHSHHPYSR